MAINWKNERRKLIDLKPCDYNPRTATKKQKADLDVSLNKFNLADPLIINTDGAIIGGHFRYNILKERGVAEVDCRVPDRPLTEEEMKELNIRLNKNTGGWNTDLLINFDINFLKDVGFEADELKLKFDVDTLEEEPDVPFTSEVLEENNYVVFTFDNTIDWKMVEEKLKLPRVQTLWSKEGYRRMGVGRVLSGKKLIELMEKI